jgi:hypothetical protein
MTTSLHRPKAALLVPFVLLAGIAVLAGTAAALSKDGPGADSAQRALRLDEATMIIEINATDGDAGLQVFLDGEPWTEMAVFAPNGRRILDVDARGRLNRFGLTELFSESNEPEFSELPLRRFKQRFPAGRYRFRGETVEGRRLVGSARFSHDTPAGPRISAPAPGATVPEDAVVARWSRGAQPRGVDIAGYRVIVEREDPLRVFNADLPASATSVTVPAEFLEPGIEYLLEIQAIERSGNQTISEQSFRVG